MLESIITLVLVSIVAFAIIMYVFLDGFDLGIGILFPWIASEKDRNIMIASVLPVWDGNETWLVLGGATLYGAFPMVYSFVLPTLYMPIIIMLAALIFRGVSFEFIHNARSTRILWVFFFCLGSTIAAFCQGIILGTFVQGFNFENGQVIVLDYQWLTPFSMMTGLAVVFGYAYLGSSWLILKTTGALQESMFHRSKILLLIVGLFMITVSLWTPFIDPQVTAFWLSVPNSFYLAVLPLLTLFTFIKIWFALDKKKEQQPFYLGFLLFLLPYLGFVLSVWPYIIPRQITLWDAAAPLKAQLFILVGMVILLPVLIGYTLYSYIVFRGKITDEKVHY